MTTTTKRAYKLQEFVAHSLSVNCLKIGRKSSRVLVTGGEDHKVNLWAIGKPNAILSLSGHSSGIDSVSFDSSEVLVAAGAASGTIKLWDLEEAKIIRTLTGHRSNCISLDFHPFGEFFASGSLDTNLKIWDIRRKGCIHTYKGHTRGVNAIRFTPDGRWVVSGGEDNTVKLWDLTAGKLLHDFKFHEGQVQCIDFHPHEFLLATGSADRTVKFWDLETFELIGSAGPETTGVRCMTFNPDGRTLLCGLHENLKVFSWEPIRSHDTVDVGWSKLSDMNVHEGKLLGCSFNQSCVGVWVVDISRIEPYAMGSTARMNGEDAKSNSGGSSLLTEEKVKANLGRLSISNSDPVKETRSLTRLSAQQSSDLNKDTKSIASTVSTPSTPQRSNVPKTTQTNSSGVANSTNLKRQPVKVQPTSVSVFNRSDVIPIVVPRNNSKLEQAAESGKEDATVKAVPLPLQTRTSELRRLINSREDNERPNISCQPDNEFSRHMDLGVSDRGGDTSSKISVAGVSMADRKHRDDKPVISRKVDTNATFDAFSRYQPENYEFRANNMDMDTSHIEDKRGGRTHSITSTWENRGRSSFRPGRTSANVSGKLSARSYPVTEENESVSANDEDAVVDLMEMHNQFMGIMKSRMSKLQVIFNFWQRHDIKGALNSIGKMSDHSVLADVISILADKTDMVTLDICSCLLPLLSELVESEMDRHQDIALDMLLKLVRVFGSVIYSSVSAPASVGVDIEAEQRLERCNVCYVELEKVKHCLPVLSRYAFFLSQTLHPLSTNFQFLFALSICRRGGSIAKSAHELNLALQDVS
ncbi:katanin p80 WD40 repeat-containing subunit B1 homolog KTN80.4-like isoform X2 [Andrographis paniculata]|uniref:katanin p80 WD40 repeat-containing subunit B1 homolog KTN80.4-like isoform X2 n=1 Tax=Andrographis paniculata TaxID=175694 RepID=UPI0021E786C2|nr:katanin p80 WD40 repeat-containing subunit B1 homolog KTN80.4-like isoform X2 [Andrographis paniculata]